jgi:hypothetical protein
MISNQTSLCHMDGVKRIYVEMSAEKIWKTVTLIFHLPCLSKLQFGLWISGARIGITECLCIVSTFWSTFLCSFSNGVAELRLSYMRILTQFRWNLELHSNKARKGGDLHEDQHTILIISGSVLLRIKSISEKLCRENKNTLYSK